MEVISRAEARELGLKFYFTGKPCKYGHVDQRYSGSGFCLTCAADYRREYAKTGYFAKHYLKTKPERQVSQADYYAKNRLQIREYQREYQKSNRHLLNKANSKYRASRKNAAPSWLTDSDHENIGAVYSMAKRLSDCLGVAHHVDHIVPLQGKNVCGLHVPWNLRAIPGTANVKKSNKLLEDVQLI